MERLRLDDVAEPLWRQRLVALLWTICVAVSGAASLFDPRVQLRDQASSSLPLLAILSFPNLNIRARLHPDKELLPGQTERQAKAGFESWWLEAYRLCLLMLHLPPLNIASLASYCLWDFGTEHGTAAALQKLVVVRVLCLLKNGEWHGMRETEQWLLCLRWELCGWEEDCVMGTGGARSCAGGDLPLTVTRLTVRKHWKSFPNLCKRSKPWGFENVRGTRSPCLVEQNVGGSRRKEISPFSYMTKSFTFRIATQLCCGGC